MRPDGFLRSRVFRTLALPAVLALGLATALGSGGGGGGGDDGGGLSDEPTKPFPSVVRYIAGSGSDESGVTITLPGGATVQMSFYLEGRYAKGTRSYTVDAGNVPRVNVSVTGTLPYAFQYDPPFGVLVEQALQWTRGRHPTAGQFRTVPAGTVRVTVTPDAGGTGQPGVDIAWIDFGVTFDTASLTWAQLDGVLDDPAAWDPFVVQAAFEYQVLKWVYDQVQLGMDGIEFVTLNDPALLAAGSGVGIDQICDLFPYDGSTGDFHFTWNDGPGEFAGALGGGDPFAVDYHDCWVDEPGRADLWVRSGTADLLNFWETPATVTLGFNPMVLHDVVETATDQDGGAITLGQTVTANTFSSGAEPGFPLITEPDTSAGINVANAMDVASGAVSSLLLPREVGDLGLGLLGGLAADPSFTFCDLGGTLGVVPTPTAATPVPASFAVTFTACRRDPADPATVDGTVTLNVEGVTGGTLAALITDDYTAALTAADIAVTTVDAVGTSTLSGGTRFSRTAVAGDFSESSESVAGGLSVAEAGVTRVIQPYAVASTLAASGAFTLGAAGDVMTVAPDNLAGAFTVTVVQAVQGTDPEAPASGVLKVEALDGSSLTITVVNGSVTLGIDTDGDGVVDDTLVTVWADLT